MAFGDSKRGFLDTKVFRKCVLERTNKRMGLSTRYDGSTKLSREKGLVSLLDTTYSSDSLGPVYTSFLRSYAYEFSKFLCNLDITKNDLIFDTTRGEYLSQNIASFLFPYNRFSQTDSSDEAVRNFYLSIIQAYLGGSTKDNIVAALERFLGISVEITENYLIGQNLYGLSDLGNQFTFDLKIDTSDPRVTDVNKIQEDANFLLSIIKPAHTFYETSLVFQEYFDIFRRGCIDLVDGSGNPIISHDGFNQKIKLFNTSICDTHHIDIFEYYYEDTRKTCITNVESVIGEDLTSQASPRYATSIFGGSWTSSDPKQYHTRRGPLAKETGELADSVNDVTVYINGVEVPIVNIIPLSGVIVFNSVPLPTDIITIDYYYINNYASSLQTNNFDTVLNHWKKNATEFPYQSVLYPGIDVTAKDPYEVSYKYKGFDLFNSSVLNTPETLLYNMGGLRNKLNDYHIIKSTGYDLGEYKDTLGDKTPLVPKSLEKKNNTQWRRLSDQQIQLNQTGYKLNVVEDRLNGEIHKDDYYPFFAGLEIDSIDNDGETNTATICEGDQLNFEMSFEETDPIGGINPECDPLTTNDNHINDLMITLKSNNCTQTKIDIDFLLPETIDPPTEEVVDFDIGVSHSEYFNGDWFYTNGISSISSLVADGSPMGLAQVTSANDFTVGQLILLRNNVPNEEMLYVTAINSLSNIITLSSTLNGPPYDLSAFTVANNSAIYTTGSTANNLNHVLPHPLLSEPDYEVIYTTTPVPVGPFTLNYQDVGAIPPALEYHKMNEALPHLNETIIIPSVTAIEIKPL